VQADIKISDNLL